MIVGGALGVLSSIGQQETARALGDQDKFSWKAVRENSILQAASAGIASGMNVANQALKGLNGEFILNPIEGAGFNIAVQVVQLATGQTHKLSWQQIVIAAGQAIADAGIADVTHEAINNPHLIPRHLAEAAQQIGSNFTNSALSSLETRHFDAETAAADALGAYIGNEAGSAIGKRMTKGAQNSLNNYLAQRQEDQHYNAWLNDLPNRIADRYSQPRSYAAQVIGYTAEDLSHWDDPTVPNGNDDNNNDNPSSNQRQTQTELAKTRAQRFTQDQQQQQTAAAQSSANNPSRFFSRVGSSIMQGVVDIDNLALGTDQALLSDAKGLFYGAKDLLTGKSHPIQAAENLIAGISAVIDDPGIIKEVFDEKLDAFESADRTQKAYMLGRIPADLLEGFATGGAAAAAGTALRTTSLIDTVGFWGRGASTVERSIDLSASNHINLLRLQQQLSIEEQQALFDINGGLSAGAIKNSRVIIPGEDLYNETLKNELSSISGNLSGWAKYTTEPIHTPYNNFEVHFYYNANTGDAYYGMHYKAVLHAQGSWNAEPILNFDYESPKFNY